MATSEKGAAEQSVTIPMAALLSALTPHLAAQQKLVDEAKNPPAKLDQTVPGGRYMGNDGRYHDAHGNKFDEDGKVSEGGAASPNAAAAIGAISSEVELDTLQRLIDAKRESIEASQKAAETGQRASDEGPSSQKLGQVNLPGETEEEDLKARMSQFDGLSRDDLEKAARSAPYGIRRFPGVDEGKNPSKAQIMRALEQKVREQMVQNT